MANKTYNPNPIDTSKIELPDELLRLGEYLAKNTHDVWAQQRIGEGWSFGELRDSERKTHPNLIPY